MPPRQNSGYNPAGPKGRTALQRPTPSVSKPQSVAGGKALLKDLTPLSRGSSGSTTTGLQTGIAVLPGAAGVPAMLIIYLIIIIPASGSLLYLLTRSNLDGGQKFVTLVIALVAAVLVGGLFCLAFMVAGLFLFWDTGISNDVAAIWVSLPASAAGNLTFLMLAAVADNWEARQMAEAGVAPSGRSDTKLLAWFLCLTLAAIILAPVFACSILH